MIRFIVIEAYNLHIYLLFIESFYCQNIVRDITYSLITEKPVVQIDEVNYN